MMDTKKLRPVCRQARQKILDLAIHGKLVPPACRQAGKTLTMNPQPRVKGKKCWFTYVIECEDGSFYKGYTEDLVGRYQQHCKGVGADYTKKHKPKQLYYWEMHYSQEEALSREKYLKSGCGREWFQREVVEKPENWEPASVLLERIRAEKERLIKEGKTRLSGRQVKRSKKSTSDTPRYENVPYELPYGWEWTVIEDVTVNRDAERIPLSLAVRKKQQNKVYDYYGAAGVIDKVENYLFDERLLLVGEDGANLLSRSKDNAFFAEGKYWVNNHAHVLDCPNKSILDYVAFVINSVPLDDYITGSAQPKLTQDNLNKILIPLPPEQEQHRIIESVNDYFSYISLLEDEIEEMNSFVQKAKSKVLDLAIHGKLVPQDPNDEPAIELLKRINPEFTPCDKGPYGNIPDSWAWGTIGDIFHHNTGKALNKSDSHEGQLLPYITTSNVYWNRFDLSEIKKMYFKDSEIAKCTVSKGDLLVCEGGDIGRAAIWNKDNTICIQNHIHRLRAKGAISHHYYLYVLMFYKSTDRIEGKGIGLLGLSSKQLDKLKVAVPPYQEQLRIGNYSGRYSTMKG